METIKLTKEEINELNLIQQNGQNLIKELGIIEYQIQKLEIQKDKLKNKLNELIENENKLGISFQNKYGSDGTIDLDKGEFIKI